MKHLVAVTLYGHGKDYVVPAFSCMAAACMLGWPGVDVIVIGDRPVPGLQFVQGPPVRGNGWAEDMLIASRSMAFDMAIDGDYDTLMLHGIDALWQSPADFHTILNPPPGIKDIYTIRAPMITARSDADFLIAREFKDFETGEQMDSKAKWIDWDASTATWVPNAGFPGADNMAIDRSAFTAVPFAEGHTPWYERILDEEAQNLCVEEEWCRRALMPDAEGIQDRMIGLNTKVKVWHVHEDGVARMWKGKTKPLKDLDW